MDWTIKTYAEANHPPVPVLRHPAALTVKSGQPLQLDSRGTTDPDGDSLSHLWFHYAEAVIPGELSLVGFDDIRLARFMPPPLTTVRMSQSELAKLAFQLLLDSLQQTAPVNHSMERGLQTQLVIRDSTTFAPPSAVFANPRQSESEQHL